MMNEENNSSSNKKCRLTLTSPDGIGDFILRLPWILAMERAGWKLQLLGRQATLECARYAGVEAELVEIKISPYSRKTRHHRNPFSQEVKAIKKFSPDLIFLGPSAPSFLEEEIVRLLSSFKLGGFFLKEKFWPSEGNQDPHELVASYGLRVPVEKSMTEFEKNQKAAQYLLKKEIKLKPFHFRKDAISVSEEFFKKLGLQQQKYIVVNVGYRQGDHFQGWGEENWIRELRLLEKETEISFVFTGIAAEKKSQEMIFSRLNDPQRHLDLTNQFSSLEQILLLLKGAAAYVGKDGGPMHLAAALKKPVLALFGGGMWGGFLPQGTRAVVLTVETPCRGCHWRCHLQEPLCVRDLQEGSLLRGWRCLQQLEEKEVLLLEQPMSLQATQILTHAGEPNLLEYYAERRERPQAERAVGLLNFLPKIKAALIGR